MRRFPALASLLVACSGDSTPAAPDAFEGPGPHDDIGFVARDVLAPGSWLVANDWAAQPNVLFVLPPADLAAQRRELFAVNRVWSFGTRDDGAAMWFSAFDEAQQDHFGLTIGDSIQNTFVFESARQVVRTLAPGPWANVNDECHTPSHDGTHLYVCRRYDFMADGAFSGWRLGRFDLTDGSFEFVRPDAPGGPFELSPQALADGRLVFELRNRPPATGGAIHVRDTNGAEQMLIASAGRPLLAPDGHRLLFRDQTSRTYKIFDLDAPGATPVQISPTMDPGSAAWSPDGATIVYTVYDAANTCDHLEQVTFAGTWSTPVRVRDCAITGEFITDIAWISVD